MNRLESMLMELKDTSEFMVDLAYSSLLYNNIEIAEEVIFLHETLDKLSEKVQDYVIEIAQKNPEDAAKVVVAIRLQTSMMYIAGAAKSIADVVIRGLSDHPVIAMSIKESDTSIALGKISANSILVGRSFEDVSLSTKTGMYVIAVKRDRNYIFGPGPSHVMEEGDLMIAKGPEDAVDFFKDVCEGKESEL